MYIYIRDEKSIEVIKKCNIGLYDKFYSQDEKAIVFDFDKEWVVSFQIGAKLNYSPTTVGYKGNFSFTLVVIDIVYNLMLDHGHRISVGYVDAKVIEYQNENYKMIKV